MPPSGEDLFVAYTVTSGSSTNAQIDEFPSGSTKAVPFATIAGAATGSLALTRRDDVLISITRASSGEVDVLDIKGRMAGKIATTANPAPIPAGNFRYKGQSVTLHSRGYRKA